MGSMRFDGFTLDEIVLAAQANHDNDSAEMAEVFSRFTNKIKAIGLNVAFHPALRDDAEQGARMGLLRAVRSYEPDRAHFAGYAPLLMQREAARQVKAVDSIRPPLAEVSQRCERPGTKRQTYAESEQPPFTIADLHTKLTPEQADLLVARYVDDIPVTDLAKSLGISKSAVSQRLKTIHNIVRPMVISAVAA